MPEPSQASATATTTTTTRSFRDVLAALGGQMGTVVTSESFEDAPVGRQLRSNEFRAKVAEVGADHLVLVTEFQKRGKEATKEPVKQFLPIEKIKRLSVLKNERILHV